LRVASCVSVQKPEGFHFFNASQRFQIKLPTDHCLVTIRQHSDSGHSSPQDEQLVSQFVVPRYDFFAPVSDNSGDQDPLGHVRSDGDHALSAEEKSGRSEGSPGQVGHVPGPGVVLESSDDFDPENEPLNLTMTGAASVSNTSTSSPSSFNDFQQVLDRN
jgi:hypothetical protein